MFESLYFLCVRIAALFNKKARSLSHGERNALNHLKEHILPNERYIWFHAASVGEFEQGRPVIERIRRQYPEKKILLTFFSPSGYELRKNYAGVDVVAYLPFATKKKVQNFLDVVKPEMAVFVKYEFWPNYLKQLHKRAIPTYLIAGIFRPSQLFFRWYGGAYRKCLTYFTHLFLQDDDSAALLAKHNILNTIVCGDPRFDRVVEIAQEAKDLPILQQFAQGAPVIVAGSTWLPDEELLARYFQENEKVKLVIVPHETDKQHLHAIYHLMHGRYVRYTEATPQNLEFARCLVVDTVGILSSIYRYATVVYVGGGFGVGIHNTLEAAVYGCPVVFGPKYAKFREAYGLIDCQGAYSVKNYKTFKNTMDRLLQAPNDDASRRYVIENCGATEAIFKAIMK